MTWKFAFWSLVVVFFLSLGLSYYLISFAKKRNLVDMPNDRSSHTIPTPRGGGISISLSLIACLIWMGVWNVGETALFLWFGATAFLVALVAVIDDVRDLNTAIRAGLYLLIACVFALSINGMSSIDLYECLLIFISTLVLAWGANLYNFMDGADGLAAIQALIVSLPIGYIFYLAGHDEMAMLCFVIAVSTAGFLIWNWPPAKIFMGDVGSCTLGFGFGGLILISIKQNILSVHIWLILLSVFIVDATLTLISRFLKREKWYQAHRSHSYQRYLQMGHSHNQLSVNFLIFGLVVLWPLAYLAHQIPQYGLFISIIVYTFLSLIWYFVQIAFTKFALNG